MYVLLATHEGIDPEFMGASKTLEPLWALITDDNRRIIAEEGWEKYAEDNTRPLADWTDAEVEDFFDIQNQEADYSWAITEMPDEMFAGDTG